nr:hypothetical protein [uncultured Sediminibacterium sp.]
MIQIKDTTTRRLNDICEAHYLGVENIVTGKLDQLTSFPKVLKEYLKQDGKLKQIITALPGDMAKLETEIKLCAKSKNIKNLNGHLKRVFDYKRFRSKETLNYNAYHLSVALDVKVCPYCNRQYTFTTIDTAGDYTRPEFDHFLSQSNHALFCLSFYNLIPSCSICNSRLKHNKKFSLKNHFHPYLNSFGKDAVFNYAPVDYNSTIGLASNLTVFLELKEDAVHKEKIKKNIEVFRLNQIYCGHADYVSEIIRKFYITNADYLKTLYNTFPNIGSKEELYRIAFGNYFHEDDHEKRVLAKLTYDIAKRLKLLEYLESL